jgi:LysM repeat protein
LSSFLRASGGSVRPGLAAGGLPYDPQNTGYVPDNTPSQAPELKAPKISNSTEESGLSKIADMAKIATMVISGLAHGGSAYADGGHVVQHGDTLSGIARRYGKSLEAILSANPSLRSNPDLIRV